MGVGRAFQREGKIRTKALMREEALVTQKSERSAGLNHGGMESGGQNIGR